MAPGGLALPPPLILTSPQAATVDLLYSPLVQGTPSLAAQPARLAIPSAASSGSPRPRSPVSSLAPHEPPRTAEARTSSKHESTNHLSSRPVGLAVPTDIGNASATAANVNEVDPPGPLSSTWALFEAATPGLTSTRIPLLLKLLDEDDEPLKAFLDDKFGPTVGVTTKCRHLDTLFLVLLELNGDEALGTKSDWRPRVVEIFVRFFSCLWDPKDERVRSQAKILSASLFPAHFELVSQCTEAYLDQADPGARARIVSFLVRLHAHIPRWRVLNWSVVWNLLFEEEYNVDQDSRSAAGGVRSSVYDIHDSSDPPTDGAGAEQLRTQLLDLALLWIGDGIPIDIFSLLKIKHHLVTAIGFEHSEIVPSRDGQTFCILFSNLPTFSSDALTVASGLKRVLDCSEHLDLSPSAMGVLLDDDQPTSHLVGAAFADVVISVINSRASIRALPYLEQRCWLECLLILVYKHDFDSDSLVHLEGPLLEALKAVTAFSPEISPDNQHIVVTISMVLLEQWDEAVVAKVISRLITNIGKLLISLGLNSAGSLPTQARVFLRKALSRFGERGVYLLQFKEASDPKLSDPDFDLFSVLPAVFKTPIEIHHVFRDVMRSLTSVTIPRPAFSLILKSLSRLADVVGTRKLPGDLISDFGSFFVKVARHTTAWTGSDLDPNPLLLVACSVLTGSRGRSSILHPDVLVLFQAFLSRFDVTKETIATVVSSTHLSASPNDRTALSALLETAEVGLAGRGRVTAASLGAVIEYILSLPSPKATLDPHQPSLDRSHLVHLAPLGLRFIAHSISLTSPDSVASLNAARLVLAADQINLGVLGRFLVDQMAAEQDAPDYLRVYNWLALASLLPNPSARPSTSRLSAIVPFATHACTCTLLRVLAPRPNNGGADRSAEHLSAGFAFMKLWLLVVRRRSVNEEVVVGAEAKSGDAGEKEREVWEACWFAWDRLLRNSDTLSPTIATVLHTLLFDLSLFLAASVPSLLLTVGPTLEHHLLLLRKERPTAKLAKALQAVRASGTCGTASGSGSEMEEIGAAAEDLKAAERLRSLGGL